MKRIVHCYMCDKVLKKKEFASLKRNGNYVCRECETWLDNLCKQWRELNGPQP